MSYTLYEQNVIDLTEEFSKDPCKRTLHNLVALARMNDLRGLAMLQCRLYVVDEMWIERLFDAMFKKEG